MSKVILALTAIASLTIVTGLYISDPVTQQNRLQAASLRRYQQAQIFDISILFYPLLLLLIVIALGAAVFIAARAFALRYTDVDQLHEQRMLTRDMWYFKEHNTPQLPNLTHLTYAPRTADSHNLTITQHHKQNKALTAGAGAAVTDGDNYAQQVQQIPTFAEALQMPIADNNLILGYDENGQARLGSIDSLFSFSVAGMSGSGKSSTALFLLAQTVMQGAKIVLVDAHATASQSLAARMQPLSSAYLCEVAETPAQILQSVRYMQSLFDARKAGHDTSQHSILFVCDEFLACLRHDEIKAEFTALIEQIATEGRKLKCIAAVLSQNFKLSRVADFRDNLTAHITCRCRPEQMRMQTGLRGAELPSDVMSLSAGEYFLLDTLGEVQKMQAPYVSESDLQQIAKTIDIAPAPRTAEHAAPVTDGEHGATVSAEHAAIISKFKAGATIQELSREMSQSKSGAKYIKALNQINDVLRMELSA